MTLNITVATERSIYQCADFCLFDLRTNRVVERPAQKIVLVSTASWSATICFTGVGWTPNVDVSEWLANIANTIGLRDPIDRLFEELLKANDWLSSVPPPHNKHSFSIGAFDGSRPIFALVSNFEEPSGLPRYSAAPSLTTFVVRPEKAKAYIAGQKDSVTRPERRGLEALAAQGPTPEEMHEALARINRRAASRNRLVSSACFTTYVNRIGESGGKVHGLNIRTIPSPFGVSPSAHNAIRELLDKQFGVGKWALRAFSGVRMDASDDYHQTRLRDKPHDPETHNNYGAYLKDKKQDAEGAEKQYRKALELAPNHVNALGNLANIFRERGQLEDAAISYEKALSAQQGAENVTWNYARMLMQANNTTKAWSILKQGIEKNPDSGRLLALTGELYLIEGKVKEALESYELARLKGANQNLVELGYAFALHQSGASIRDCIGAYRTAIALSPTNAVLKLNLAQLIFVAGDKGGEADRLLEEALRGELNGPGLLEAQFYLLAHTDVAPEPVILKIRELVATGVRTDWNFSPNIAAIDKKKAALLELVAQVMSGQQPEGILDQVLTTWMT